MKYGRDTSAHGGVHALRGGTRMTKWWPAVGELSLLAGLGLGLVWAFWSTAQRRQKFLRAAVPPVGQRRWFLLSFCSMSAYLTLMIALGLSAMHGLLPPGLVWLLIGAGSMTFISAMLFTTVQLPRVTDPAPAQAQEPPSAPPLLPFRKSA